VVLAQQADGFIHPRLTELGDDQRKTGNDLATSSSKYGRAYSSLLCSVYLTDRVNQNRHAQALGLGIHAHARLSLG